MGWHKNGRHYYRSRRVGKKVRREYAGAGDEARLAAALDERRQERRLAARRVRRGEQARWNDALERLSRLIAAADLLTRGALLAAGYRQHHRGEWRRRRSTQEDTKMTETTTTTTLQELVQRAQAGDASVLPALKRVLDDDPALWQRCGDLAVLAQAAWLDLLAGPDLFLHEAVERKLGELRGDLAGPDPTPVEKLLVERVAACWLQAHFADVSYAQARGPQATPAVLRELMKRQESAQGRYLAALKQLAVLRKLVTPAAAPLDPPRDRDATGGRQSVGRPRLSVVSAG